MQTHTHTHTCEREIVLRPGVRSTLPAHIFIYVYYYTLTRLLLHWSTGVPYLLIYLHMFTTILLHAYFYTLTLTLEYGSTLPAHIFTYVYYYTFTRLLLHWSTEVPYLHTYRGAAVHI